MRKSPLIVELIGLCFVVVALIGVDWRLGLLVLGVALVVGAAVSDRSTGFRPIVSDEGEVST